MKKGPACPTVWLVGADAHIGPVGTVSVWSDVGIGPYDLLIGFADEKRKEEK